MNPLRALLHPPHRCAHRNGGHTWEPPTHHGPHRHPKRRCSHCHTTQTIVAGTPPHWAPTRAQRNGIAEPHDQRP